MNYIKKKIKSHKKGHDKDDDFDNIAQNQPSSASEGISELQSPPQQKDTEEWQFFQQLTQRVQDTVEKTQSTLIKLKDSSTIAEITKPDYYFSEPSENESKPLPPTTQSWVHFEEDTGDEKSVIGEEKKPKAPPPPRPPLPKLIEADSFDLPPTTESSKAESATDEQVTTSLLDEFGFQTESASTSVPSSVRIDVSTLLTLDTTDEGPDPFDTSFVDTSGKILIDNITVETKAASPISKPDIDFSGLEISEQITEANEPDPFDTSFVDNITSANISRKPSVTENFFDKFEGIQIEKDKSETSLELKPEGGSSSLENEIAADDETMSNPFLSDSEPSGFSKALFDIDSQTNDLFGAAKPKSTTNPFETGPTETVDILGSSFGTAAEGSLLDEKSKAAEQNLFDPFGFDSGEAEALKHTALVQPVIQKPESTKCNSVTSDQFDIFSQPSVPASTSADIFSQPSVTVSSCADIFSQPPALASTSADIFSHTSAPISTGADLFSQPSVPVSTGVDIFSQTSAQVSSNANLLEQQLGATSDNASEDLFSTEFKASGQATPGFPDSKRDSAASVGKDAITSPEQYIQSGPLSEAASVDGNAEAATPQGILSMSRKTSSAIDELDDFFGGGGTQTVAQEKSSITAEPNKVASDPFATIFGDEPVKDVKDATLEPTAFGTGKPTLEPTPAAIDELATKDSEASSVLNPFGTPSEPKQVETESSFDPFSGFLDSENKEGENVTSISAADAFSALDSFSTSDTKPSDNVVAALTIADPFDTSMMEPEVVKDAIPFTETAAFEAFAAKFEEAIEKLDEQPIIKDDFDPFAAHDRNAKPAETQEGFGVLDAFDPFVSLTKPPENTPTKLPTKEPSQDSFDDDEGPDFSVVIRPKMKEKSEINASLEPPPLIPPPPKTPTKSPVPQSAHSKFNPFDVTFESSEEAVQDGSAVVANGENLFGEIKPQPPEETTIKRTESQESPTTPLFDEDTSQPLEDFPQKFEGDGWEMVLRQPNKKKITGNRFWKKVYVRLSEGGVLQLFNKKEDNDPFQELPLQACYSLSPIGTQQFDAYGKIFTVKLQYIFYRERVGVRPGQISKVMQGHITSVGQIAKLGLPLEHAPQVSQLLKLGTQCYTDIKTFVQVTDDALFHLTVHRDRSLTYKTEEVQVTVQDEFYVEQDKTGHVFKQQARVRIFFLAFITGMPDVEIGLNDLTRQGKEVVGRYDIIPVVTEEWIRLENCEFHSCVAQEEFEKNRIVKLHPPDACLFELMRFRIRPPRNRELPLQVKAIMLVTKARVELRIDVLVPGYHSRKHGQVPCEDIQIRFAIPECWVYLFRVEKHFRYGSLKAAARRPGKIKGLERIMGTAQTLDPSLIEVSCGHAKYEHAFKSVVWRIPRLPKEGQGAYTTQLFLLRLDMTAFDQIPDTLSQYVEVEFTMPATTVSHTTVRSVSVTNSNPPEKYVRYMAKHEYRVEIEFTCSPTESEYVTAAAVATTPPTAEIPSSEQEDDDDDSD